MHPSKNNLGLRIVIGAFIVSFLIMALACYRTYAEDMKKELSEKVTEYLPDMESSLAQL